LWVGTDERARAQRNNELSTMEKILSHIRKMRVYPPYPYWPSWYKWNIVESGIKHHKPETPWTILIMPKKKQYRLLSSLAMLLIKS
jgi:hypothetical protein